MIVNSLIESLKEMVEKFPEAGDYLVVFRTCSKIHNDDDKEYTAFVDSPIYAEVLDHDHKEYALIDSENWPKIAEFLNIDKEGNPIQKFEDFNG